MTKVFNKKRPQENCFNFSLGMRLEHKNITETDNNINLVQLTIFLVPYSCFSYTNFFLLMVTFIIIYFKSPIDLF